MKPIDQKTIQKFVGLAAERLEGDWIVIGGTVLPLLGVEHRTTIDIDVVGPKEATQEQTLILMEIADGLGLPVEAINQAGAFFLHRIDGFEKNLTPVVRGSKAVIYRPDVTLFVLLKIGRLTESDLEDCLKFLEYARDCGEPIDAGRIRKAVSESAGGEVSERKASRLRTLIEALDG